MQIHLYLQCSGQEVSHGSRFLPEGSPLLPDIKTKEFCRPLPVYNVGNGTTSIPEVNVMSQG